MMNLITIDYEKCNPDDICVTGCLVRIIRLSTKKDYPKPSSDFKDSCLK
jgi:hypothetical protein